MSNTITVLAPGSDTPETLPVGDAEARALAPLLVSSIEEMAHSRLHTVTAETPIAEVAAHLASAQIGVVVVCDAAGAAIGTVTETQLVKYLGLGQADFFTNHARDVMTKTFTTCEPQELLSDVLAMMHERSLIHLLLLGPERQPLGVLIARDGLRALLAAGNHEEALLRNYVMGVGYQ